MILWNEKYLDRQLFKRYLIESLFVICSLFLGGCYSAKDPHPEVISMDSLNLVEGELKVVCPRSGRMELVPVRYDENGKIQMYAMSAEFEAIPYDNGWLYYHQTDTSFYDCAANRFSFSPSELMGKEGIYQSYKLLSPALSGELLFQGTEFGDSGRVGFFLLNLKEQRVTLHYNAIVGYERILRSIMRGIQDEIDTATKYQPDGEAWEALVLLTKLYPGVREYLKELSLLHSKWSEERQVRWYDEDAIRNELLHTLLSKHQDVSCYQFQLNHYVLFFPQQQVAICTEYFKEKDVESISRINIAHKYCAISYKDCHVKAKSAGVKLVKTDEAQIRWKLPHLLKGSGGESLRLFYYLLTLGEKSYQFKCDRSLELLESVDVNGDINVALMTPSWSSCPGEVFFLTCFLNTQPPVLTHYK